MHRRGASVCAGNVDGEKPSRREGSVSSRLQHAPGVRAEGAVVGKNLDDRMSKLADQTARTDLINRLRRAEGQLRGVQRMIEEGEDCLKIGQQFSAVRKALERCHVRMAMCFMEQELEACMRPHAAQKGERAAMLKDMETMLTRLG